MKEVLRKKKIIAKFMGLDFVKVGYSGTKSETSWQRAHNDWMYSNDLNSVGNYFVNIEDNFWIPDEELDYLDWGQLMLVVERISYQYKFYPREVTALSEELTIFATKETVYEYVLEFCQWFNSQSKHKC